jgi:hypothetical protein
VINILLFLPLEEILKNQWSPGVPSRLDDGVIQLRLDPPAFRHVLVDLLDKAICFARSYSASPCSAKESS